MNRAATKKLTVMKLLWGIPINKKVAHLAPITVMPSNSKVLARSKARKVEYALADEIEEAYLNFMEVEYDSHQSDETRQLALGQRVQGILQSWCDAKMIQEGSATCGPQNNNELTAAQGVLGLWATWKTIYEPTLTQFVVDRNPDPLTDEEMKAAEEPQVKETLQ